VPLSIGVLLPLVHVICLTFTSTHVYFDNKIQFDSIMLFKRLRFFLRNLKNQVLDFEQIYIVTFNFFTWKSIDENDRRYGSCRSSLKINPLILSELSKGRSDIVWHSEIKRAVRNSLRSAHAYCLEMHNNSNLKFASNYVSVSSTICKKKNKNDKYSKRTCKNTEPRRDCVTPVFKVINTVLNDRAFTLHSLSSR